MMLLRSVADAASRLGSFLSTSTFELSMSATIISVPSPLFNVLAFSGTDLLYWLNPCDADALAGCISSSADLLFVDLDEASFDSFQSFAGDQDRLLLFYQPSAIDPYFV